MSTQTPTAYIIVPIAQPPEKDGWYHLQGTLGIGAQSESNCIKPEGDCGYDATQHEVDKINYLKSVLNHSK